MGFDKTWLVKKNSDLNDWKFYDTSVFLFLQASNNIIKLCISYRLRAKLVTVHNQYSYKQKKIHTIEANRRPSDNLFSFDRQKKISWWFSELWDGRTNAFGDGNHPSKSLH